MKNVSSKASFSQLIEASRLETDKNARKQKHNMCTDDIGDILPYDNTAFLSLVNAVYDFFKED